MTPSPQLVLEGTPAPLPRRGRRAAPLGSQADSVVRTGVGKSPEERLDAAKVLRRKGLELLSLIQRITIRPRVKSCCRCRYRPKGGKGSEVAIYAKDGVPYFAGLQRCASIWNCPSCATKIAGVRRAEIERVARLHVEAGGCMAWLTLTTSHSAGMNGGALRRVVSGSWREVQQSRAYRAAKKRLGLVGTLRAFETTEGQNGFHPHIHVALFFERDFAPEVHREEWQETNDEGELETMRGIEVRAPNRELAAFADVIFTAWASAIASRGYPEPERNRGVKLEMMRPGTRAWGAYLTKIGFEFASAQHKQGRNGNRSMWQVAEDAAYAQIEATMNGEVTDYATVDGSGPDGERVEIAELEAMGFLRLARSDAPLYVHPEKFRDHSPHEPRDLQLVYRLYSTLPDVQLWRDYEEMIRGARQLEWSRGLRDRYQVDTQTDLELMDAPEGGTRVVAFAPELWDDIRPRGPGGLADLLEAAMDGPTAIYLTLSSWGIDVSNTQLRWGDDPEPPPNERGELDAAA